MLFIINIVFCFVVVLGVFVVFGVCLFFNFYYLYFVFMLYYVFIKDVIRYCFFVILIEFLYYCNIFCSYFVKCKCGVDE